MNRMISYREAIREALTQEMERCSDVFVYGIGVPDHKGIFGSTTGLAEKFGSDRCFDTPLCESAMTGFGLGAAINGLRPVHVHMRADFLLLAMNQLANMVSSYRYVSGGKLNIPMVIRAVVGRGWGQGIQHSKSMHSVYAHIPGLKVVIPTTAHDAKGLVIAAIRDNNPVLIFEHRLLYDAVDDVPEQPYTVSIGGANVLREGDDITVVATSWMNVEALRAAEIMAKRNIRLEVVDARTAAPLDDEVIIKSVNKTGHCLIADNDWVDCGFSAEIAARVAEKCFGRLKSPVQRIGYAHTPCPCTRPLENAFYANAVDIVRIIENKFNLSNADLSHEKFYTYEHKFKGPF